uniref:Uncharacterized protein n=1 Tax=Avena sativa TaxID=4498 RepID=A0ACD5X7W9_AVESA
MARARFSGATVLLILVATVSVYTCAILAGAALGRTLDSSTTTTTTRQPPVRERDIALRVSVSFRGLAENVAKELWGGQRREEGRSGGHAHAGPGDRASAAAIPSSAARANAPLSQAELRDRQRQVMIQQIEAGRMEMSEEGVVVEDTKQQTARPLSRSRHSNFSDEITEGSRPRAGGVVKVGPWGGAGGQAFHMRGGGVPRLLSITLYHADAVHAFSFEYIVAGVAGVRRTTGQSGGRSHGSKGLRATINFSSDERLTAVEGTFGRCVSLPAEVVVTSLTFRTDKGRTYGPYGEETGTSFSIPAANGACIVGFWGRSGWLLDAIGVYIMPCQVYNPTFLDS